MDNTNKDRLMSCPEVEKRICASHSFIYREMQKGTFPRPLKLSPRAVRWRESEIEAWLEGRPRAERDI